MKEGITKGNLDYFSGAVASSLYLENVSRRPSSALTALRNALMFYCSMEHLDVLLSDGPPAWFTVPSRLMLMALYNVSISTKGLKYISGNPALLPLLWTLLEGKGKDRREVMEGHFNQLRTVPCKADIKWRYCAQLSMCVARLCVCMFVCE